MSSQKVGDLRAHEVRTVNRTLDEATCMRKKVTRLYGAGRFPNIRGSNEESMDMLACRYSTNTARVRIMMRAQVKDDGSAQHGVIRKLI